MATNQTISITKINDVWMRVSCPEVYMELDIQERFSFEIPNAQFDPRVKKGHWDGIIKLFNRRDKRMYVGLLLQLLEFCDKKEWQVEIDQALIPNGDDQLDLEDIKRLSDDLIKPHSNGSPITPHSYQYEAVQYMLNMDRSLCLSATSSGKSLMIYLAARIYQLMDELVGKKIFIVVPSVNLVEQLYADFVDYSTFEGQTWHASAHVQKISGKYGKRVEKQIVITTWQSMKNLPHHELEQIGAIFVDEAHGVKASVLSGLLESLTQCPIRHGLTGTLDGFECNELVIKGLLGPSKVIATNKDIIESGAASDIDIKMVLLNHSDATRRAHAEYAKAYPANKKYNAEVDFLYQSSERTHLILEMIDSLEGNTLVLFDKVEKYGEPLYRSYLELHPDSTFLITGDVDSDVREDIRVGVEDHDNCTIFASYGTMSTGVSIKRLHNLVIVSSTKSKVRILQSIGRLMRKHFSKSEGRIYDIVDNLTDISKNQRPNYSMEHAMQRLEYYKKEQFKVDFITLDL